jgi:hypothetical protein
MLAQCILGQAHTVEPLVTELASSTESKPNTRLICDELARLGYPDAQRLKKLAS